MRFLKKFTEQMQKSCQVATSKKQREKNLCTEGRQGWLRPVSRLL
jgi:hypothetical protein